jgi:hypothetical protein
MAALRLAHGTHHSIRVGVLILKELGQLGSRLGADLVVQALAVGVHRDDAGEIFYPYFPKRFRIAQVALVDVQDFDDAFGNQGGGSADACRLPAFCLSFRPCRSRLAIRSGR